MSDRVGFWADMENPYVTYHNDYIESEWWALKTINEKGLLYKGHKIVPYCPRCGTSLSSHPASVIIAVVVSGGNWSLIVLYMFIYYLLLNLAATLIKR